MTVRLRGLWYFGYEGGKRQRRPGVNVTATTTRALGFSTDDQHAMEQEFARPQFVGSNNARPWNCSYTLHWTAHGLDAETFTDLAGHGTRGNENLRMRPRLLLSRDQPQADGSPCNVIG